MTTREQDDPVPPFTPPGVEVSVPTNEPDRNVSSAGRQRSKLRVFAILAALYLSIFVAALDQTIIATAIPTITTQLHSAAGYTWIGGSYLLANAATSPIWAALSNIWGRKPIILAAVALFLLSSIICALSNKIEMLVIGRAIQGASSGGLIPLCLIIISDLFSLRERSLHIGLTECMWSVAGAVGPILGGAFTEALSWRWAFWINLPVSGVAFLLLLFFLDVHNPATPMMEGLRAIDWFGSISILGLVLMLLLGLDFGGAIFPWNSPKVICLIVFGALMSIVFIYSEKRLAKYPLMPISVLGHRSIIASLLLCFFHGFVFIASEYYLPLFFQSAKGLSPFHSGLLILPITLSEAFLGIAVGVIIHLTGRYIESIWVGTVLMAIGNGLYILLKPDTSVGVIIIFELIAGAGAGLLFQSPLTAIQAMVSQQEVSSATAAFAFVRNIATSMSIVIGGVVFQNGMGMQESKLRAIGLPKNVTDALSGATAAANVYLGETLSDPSQKEAVRMAFAKSLKNMWILYSCVAVLAVIAGAFIMKAELSTEHVETRTGLISEKPATPGTQAGVLDQRTVSNEEMELRSLSESQPRQETSL